MFFQIIILTLIIEFFTIIGRILFGSVKERYKEVNLPYKIRIHHGYIGIGLILIYIFYPVEVIFIIGLSLFLSDLIHHFLILPIWIGKTEFP